MSTTKQPATKDPAPRTLATVSGGLNAWLLQQRTELARALPRMLEPDQFIRIALTTVKQDEYLMEADPISFMAAVFEAASAGLLIDGTLGHAYLVSFYSKKRGCRLVQLIPGYKGLMELARRSGEIAKIEARVVRAGDRFRYAYGIHQVLEHTPTDSDDTLERWTHVYAIAWFKDQNTPPQFEVMTYKAVMAIKKRSASVVAGRSSPWDTDEIPMAQKTAIRRLMRLLPLSTSDQRIVEKDEAFDAGIREAEFDMRAAAPSTVEELSTPRQAPAGPLDELSGVEKDAHPTGEPIASGEERAPPVSGKPGAPGPGAGAGGSSTWDHETMGDPPPDLAPKKGKASI